MLLSSYSIGHETFTRCEVVGNHVNSNREVIGRLKQLLAWLDDRSEFRGVTEFGRRDCRRAALQQREAGAAPSVRLFSVSV